jgi:hypothetical protein
MKRYVVLGLFLSLLAPAFAVIILPSASAAPAVQGTGAVFHLVPSGGTPPVTAGDPVEGATASIHRTSNGVTININTVGLDPHHAYTVWLFEVNCGTCTGPVQLTGKIVGESGVGNFSGHLKINSDETRPVQDPFGGDFHAVIADHGPLDPSDLPNAIKSPVPPFSNGVQNWKQVVIFAP